MNDVAYAVIYAQMQVQSQAAQDPMSAPEKWRTIKMILL